MPLFTCFSHGRAKVSSLFSTYCLSLSLFLVFFFFFSFALFRLSLLLFLCILCGQIFVQNCLPQKKMENRNQCIYFLFSSHLSLKEIHLSISLNSCPLVFGYLSYDDHEPSFKYRLLCTLTKHLAPKLCPMNFTICQPCKPQSKMQISWFCHGMLLLFEKLGSTTSLDPKFPLCFQFPASSSPFLFFRMSVCVSVCQSRKVDPSEPVGRELFSWLLPDYEQLLPDWLTGRYTTYLQKL